MKPTPQKSILFSTPMVRAILEGHKTMTRRVIKPQPPADTKVYFSGLLNEWRWADISDVDDEANDALIVPYAPGDLLWAIQLRPISFGNGKYAVGDDGNIYDVSRGEPRRKPVRLGHNGYEEITLRRNGEQRAFRINRLVAEAFYGPPPDGREVCRHLDHNKRNNDPLNLDWGTPKENSLDTVSVGALAGAAASKAILTEEQVAYIRASSEPQAVLAAKMGVGQPTISKIKSGKRWSLVRPPAPPRNCPINFSRITLRVTAVKVEKLQDISTMDAKAEGIPEYAAEAGALGFDVEEEGHFWDNRTTVENFARLWNSIHGEGAWEANPFVAAYSFERVKP